MIKRYSRPEMSKIWDDQNKYEIWLEIELLALEAQAELGLVDRDLVSRVRQTARVSASRIEEIEKTTKHDIIAFLTNIEEHSGQDSRFVHQGMTSSDVLDTCLSVQLKQAGEIILNDLIKLKKVIAAKAIEHKYTLCIGRSHGIHAEATTFGLKLALWFDECNRNIDRISNAIKSVSVGQISGAVGTYEHMEPFVEQYVCEKLDLRPVNIATQVIQRDIYADFMLALAQVASMIDKIGTEIRHLQRTEVREVEEYFSKGQKGSSAMPHKRNPITSENICGQARFIRTNALAAIENNTLWHERDISHSSVERVIMPDSTISLDYILNRTIKLIDKLVIYPDKMKYNLELTNGLIHSQKVLLALINKGVRRQEAYVLVQRNAMKTWDEGSKFIDNISSDDEVKQYLSFVDIEELFSFDKLYKSVDFIFKRCGLE